MAAVAVADMSPSAPASATGQERAQQSRSSATQRPRHSNHSHSHSHSNGHGHSNAPTMRRRKSARPWQPPPPPEVSKALGNARIDAFRRQIGGVVFVLGLCIAVEPLTAITDGLDQRVTPSTSMQWSEWIGAVCQLAMGLWAVVLGACAMLLDAANASCTMLLVALAQLGWVPLITDLVALGKEATSPYEIGTRDVIRTTSQQTTTFDVLEFVVNPFIPNDYNPTKQDVRFFASMGIFGVLVYGIALFGGLMVSALVLLSTCTKPFPTLYNHTSRYYRRILLGYAFLLILAGMPQLLLGAYSINQLENTSPYEPSVGVAMMIVRYPELSIFMGGCQMLLGYYALARFLAYAPIKKTSHEFQFFLGVTWVFHVCVQYVTQVGVSERDQLKTQLPSLVAMSMGLYLVPAYLDLKMRTVHTNPSPRFYALPTKEDMKLMRRHRRQHRLARRPSQWMYPDLAEQQSAGDSVPYSDDGDNDPDVDDHDDDDINHMQQQRPDQTPSPQYHDPRQFRSQPQQPQQQQQQQLARQYTPVPQRSSSPADHDIYFDQATRADTSPRTPPNAVQTSPVDARRMQQQPRQQQQPQQQPQQQQQSRQPQQPQHPNFYKGYPSNAQPMQQAKVGRMDIIHEDPQMQSQALPRARSSAETPRMKNPETYQRMDSNDYDSVATDDTEEGLSHVARVPRRQAPDDDDTSQAAKPSSYYEQLQERRRQQALQQKVPSPRSILKPQSYRDDSSESQSYNDELDQENAIRPDPSEHKLQVDQDIEWQGTVPYSNRSLDTRDGDYRAEPKKTKNTKSRQNIVSPDSPGQRRGVDEPSPKRDPSAKAFRPDSNDPPDEPGTPIDPAPSMVLDRIPSQRRLRLKEQIQYESVRTVPTSNRSIDLLPTGGERIPEFGDSNSAAGWVKYEVETDDDSVDNESDKDADTRDGSNAAEYDDQDYEDDDGHRQPTSYRSYDTVSTLGDDGTFAGLSFRSTDSLLEPKPQSFASYDSTELLPDHLRVRRLTKQPSPQPLPQPSPDPAAQPQQQVSPDPPPRPAPQLSPASRMTEQRRNNRRRGVNSRNGSTRNDDDNGRSNGNENNRSPNAATLSRDQGGIQSFPESVESDDELQDQPLPPPPPQYGDNEYEYEYEEEVEEEEEDDDGDMPAIKPVAHISPPLQSSRPTYNYVNEAKLSSLDDSETIDPQDLPVQHQDDVTSYDNLFGAPSFPTPMSTMPFDSSTETEVEEIESNGTTDLEERLDDLEDELANKSYMEGAPPL